MTERDTIWGGAAWAALILAAAMIFEAPLVRAQSRHDADQAWIRKTIKDERRKAWERDDELGRGTVRHHRPYAGGGDVSRYRRHFHEYRHERRDPPEHAATRVYGVVMHREGFSERDATAHVQCYPPVVGRSNERSSQDRAWDDAQLDWANAVRWLYGERFLDIRNANPVQKQCSPSSVSETQAGKFIQGAKEAITGNTETANRWRCQVRAGPCQAPIETTPAIHGEKPQQ